MKESQGTAIFKLIKPARSFCAFEAAFVLWNARNRDLSVGLKLTNMERNEMDAETGSVGLCSCLCIVSCVTASASPLN